MKKVLVIAMLFCGTAQMAEFERVIDRSPDRDFGIPIIKITKENIIGSIKESCFGDKKYGPICSFLPTTIQETLWGEKEKVAFDYSDSYVVSFIEVERILENLSTFKLPQNTNLSIYHNMIKTTVQDISKDIQKAYNNKDMIYNGPVFFELVKHYKTLTTKYANMQITQAMINPLKTSAQQKYQALVKLKNQRRKLEEQQREEIESRSEIKALRAKIDSLYDKEQELNKLQRDGKIEYKKYVEEFNLILKEREELSNKILKPLEPLGSPELDAQISSKEIELSLLVQEIHFLEMQREIQKVEQMSKAQLTQYVIQHSVCNNKQLKEERECVEGSQGFNVSACDICADAEEVTNLAKRGLYNPGFMFSPTELEIVGLHLHSCREEDEEGNIWVGFFDDCNWKRIIINRTFTLNDIAQALKENDMPKLLQSLRDFEYFAKNKERDFIPQLIKQIKRTYKIDDGYRD